MKNKIIFGLFTGSILILVTAGLSFAADSSSIGVSCSIPSVPGLNAPPFPDKNTQQAVSAPIPQQQNADELKNAPEETLTAAIQQETKKEIVLASGETSSEITQTIYSR